MFNKSIIMGRLTSAPELRQTPNNVSTCQFTVAVDRGFASKTGEREADFVPVVAWRQTAEFVCKYFSKGSMVIVEGSLRTRTYADKRFPEVKHYVMEIYADQVHFGETKKAASAHRLDAPPPPQITGPGSGGHDESGDMGASVIESPSRQDASAVASAPASTSGSGSGSAALSIGNLNEFEEILGEGDLPF